MTGNFAQFTSLKLKDERHVTYGDNNRGRILGRGNAGTRNSTTIEKCSICGRTKAQPVKY